MDVFYQAEAGFKLLHAYINQFLVTHREVHTIKQTMDISVNEARDLSRLPVVQKNKVECRKYKNLSDAALMGVENGSDLIIKLEPEIDEFKLENVPRDVSIKLSAEEYIKREPKLIIENQILNTALAQQEDPVGRQETHVSIETSERVHVIEKMHDISYEDWEIKNEEHCIKEDLEQSETGNLVSSAEPEKSLTVHKYQHYHDHTREHNLMDCFQYDRGDCQTIEKNKPKNNLFRHKNPDKINMFKCDQCEYQTIEKGNLKRHFLRHKNPEEVNIFKCDRCKFKTIYKESIKEHVLRHGSPEEVNMFKCDQCEFQTMQKGNLKRHLLRHKDPEEVNMFKCDRCKFQTIYKESIRDHVLRHENPEEDNMFKCDQCEFRTIEKRNLMKHLLRHKNPEKCDQCKFQTIYKDYLKTHLLRHKNPGEVNMFKCDQCEYQTIEKGNLKKHFLRHKNPEKVNTFKCHLCEFQTIYKKSLKLHLLRHKNQK